MTTGADVMFVVVVSVVAGGGTSVTGRRGWPGNSSSSLTFHQHTRLCLHARMADRTRRGRPAGRITRRARLSVRPSVSYSHSVAVLDIGNKMFVQLAESEAQACSHRWLMAGNKSSPGATWRFWEARGCQTNDKVDRLLWAWFSCPTKSVNHDTRPIFSSATSYDIS